MGAVEIELVVQAPAWGGTKEWEQIFLPAAEIAISSTPGLTDPVQLCVLLSDDQRIAFHNKQWRGKSSPTNVLSFPAPGLVREKGFLGDIIMSIETLQREAKDQRKPLSQHALHLFVHGLLHLLGHDHGNAGDAQVMESMEKKILLELGQPDPYEEEERESGGP
jgi:probable rRNA maturation factor